MKHVVVCECIGQTNEQENKLWSSISDYLIPGTGQYLSMPSTKPWVAKIIGLSKKYGFVREFLHGKKDLAKSSGSGNRGVYLRFVVDSGVLYEVKRRTSWRSSERFFFVFDNGEMTKLTKQEAVEWLQKTQSA